MRSFREATAEFLQLSEDAFGGLDYLAGLPFVAKERIAVVGFSLGGWVIKDGILADMLVRPQGANRFKAVVSLMVRADRISERSTVATRSILLRSGGGKDVHIFSRGAEQSRIRSSKCGCCLA